MAVLCGLLASHAVAVATTRAEAPCRAGDVAGSDAPERLPPDPDDVPLDGTVVVSPDRVEPIEPLEAGDVLTCTITIRNRHRTRTTFQLEPMGVVGTGAAGVEFVEPDSADATHTAGSWLQPAQPSITLEPRGVARVPVTVTVPASAPRFAAYGSINVVSRTRAPGPGGTNLGIESQVAVPFLLRVGTQGRARLQLRNVTAPRVRWDRERWTLSADVENTGTLHATPNGRVRVRSIFGNTVATLPVAGRPLLPGGRAPIEVSWDGVPWLGLYRYDLRVDAARGDGDARTVDVARGWFVTLPPWWVLALLALLAAAMIIRGRIRRRDDREWLATDSDADLDDADDDDADDAASSDELD